jgi:RimJ/RimL family protein N-acetyltransferase
VPIGPVHSSDLLLVHADEQVWPWYGQERPDMTWAEERAALWGDLWNRHGIHKWIAYDRLSGDVVGRGGLSRIPVDDDWGQIHAFLPNEPWVRFSSADGPGPAVHTDWFEIGWALRGRYWGQGFASEIGRAGLAVAFDVLGARAVVSCTELRNHRSRAVMGRIGLRYAGQIRGRGVVEGLSGEQEDAPFAVCVMLRREWLSISETDRR